jgi:serine/threonine-protein kinase RsbW
MRFRIEIPNERAQLHGLLTAIDRALAENAISAALRDDLRLITEEVVSNAMDHGEAHDGEVRQHQISVDIARHEDGLHVEFRDTGKAFDPLMQPLPVLDGDILDRPIGGLGVHLVRELAKSVRYTRLEPHNILHVVLRTT